MRSKQVRNGKLRNEDKLLRWLNIKLTTSHEDDLGQAVTWNKSKVEECNKER